MKCSQSPVHGKQSPAKAKLWTVGCRLWTLLLALSGALVFLTGCKTPAFKAVDSRTAYKPDNIFPTSGILPAEIKRVAVLPLACDTRQSELAAGRDALEPVLLAELIKTKQFEVVKVSSEELWRLTGRTGWSGGEILPANFLDGLKMEYGCDAVLFSELTEFRAYSPLAIGWRLKLVDAHSKKTIWAGDENFDAGKPEILAAARQYQQLDQQQLDYPSSAAFRRVDKTAGWLAANSPRWFGQYSIASLFDTLPAR